MAKKKDELIVGPTEGNELLASPQQLPDYMKDDAGAGTALLAQYIMPPMLKVVQKQSKDELLDRFGKGAVIIMPEQTLLFNPNDPEPFEFVVLGFYVEFISWNPIERAGEGAIRERSLDPTSELAQKCKDQKRWLEPIQKGPTDDKQLFIRNCEHLNFIIAIESDIVEPMPHIMSFARGEHKTGRKLANMIRMRRGPIYGGRYAAVTSGGGEGRKKGDNTWCGFDITNAVEAWVGAHKYEAYKKLSNELNAAMNGGRVQAQYDVEDIIIDEGQRAGASSTEF